MCSAAALPLSSKPKAAMVWPSVCPRWRVYAASKRPRSVVSVSFAIAICARELLPRRYGRGGAPHKNPAVHQTLVGLMYTRSITPPHRRTRVGGGGGFVGVAPG